MEFNAELSKFATVKGGVNVTLFIDFETTPPDEIDYDELMTALGHVCKVDIEKRPLL
mgnify:CR=1 FL=1